MNDVVGIVDRVMRDGRLEFAIPAMAYAVVRDQSVVHVGGLGEPAPGPTSHFRIASMSKSVTAAVVLRLAEEGRLRLDDPAVEYLPWLATAGIPGGPARLTVFHLLTMAPGLPTDDPWGDRQEDLPINEFDRLVADGLSFCRPPGVEFEYSNLGYALLGRVVEQITGSAFIDVARDLVLCPVGMDSSTYRADAVPDRMVGHAPVAGGLTPEPDVGPGAFSPMGGLWSTTWDITRWIRAMLRADVSGSGLPRVLAAMQVPQRFSHVERVSIAGADRVRSSSYGYGLYVTDDVDLGRFVHHSGGYPGFGSHMRWHPASGWGIVGFGNRTYAPMVRLCDVALTEIVASDTDRGDPAPQPWRQTVVAMGVAEHLLTAWDDELFDRHAAMNLDLDQPRDERRQQWRDVAARLGRWQREPNSITHRSPAHARWKVTGTDGGAWLEVLMSPESPPRIQRLAIEDA